MPLRRSRPRRALDGTMDFAALRSRLRNPMDPARFYDAASKAGIDLGPACRSIRHLWYDGPEVLAEVSTDSAAGDEHASLLDGCLQVVGVAAMQAGGETAPTRVLTSIGRISIVGALQGAVVVHATASAASSDGACTVALRVADLEGRLVAEAMDVMVQPVAAAATAPRDWFYTVEWLQKPLVISRESSAGDIASDPAAMLRLRQGTTARAHANGLDQYPRLKRRLDGAVAAFIRDALRKLGAQLPPGKTIAAADLRTELGVAERHARAFARMLDILGEQGDLAVEGPGRWIVSARPRALDPLAECVALEREFPLFAAEIALTRQGGARLAEILRGTLDVLQALTPDGDFSTLERLYAESPAARTFNPAVADVVAEALTRRQAGQPFRMFEIGGGTGGTTRFVADLVARHPGVEYALHRRHRGVHGAGTRALCRRRRPAIRRVRR